jgi:hypothetical protein
MNTYFQKVNVLMTEKSALKFKLPQKSPIDTKEYDGSVFLNSQKIVIGTATNKTIMGAGIFLKKLILSKGNPNMIINPIIPITAICQCAFKINLGISIYNSIGPSPLYKVGSSPNKTGICFPIIINPIAASIP